MDKEQYISERLEEQINWYDRKSQSNQRRFKSLRATEIICAAAIPFIVGISDFPYGNYLIGLLGIIITISAGMSTLSKYQENWLTYRTTCENLQHEKFLFLTNSNPYNNENSFTKLVERVENIIARENMQWQKTTVEKSSGMHNDEKS